MLAVWRFDHLVRPDRPDIKPALATLEHEGRHVAACAIDIARFVISPDRLSGDLHAHFEKGWRRFAHSAVSVRSGAEIMVAMATRRPPAPDGATLRCGWLAVGHATEEAAAQGAACAALDFIA